MKMNYSEEYKELLRKFDSLTRKEYAALALQGIQITVIAALSLFLIFVLAESLGHYSSVVRTVMIFVLILFSLGVLTHYFIRPGLKYLNITGKPDYYGQARKVGLFFPSLRDELLNAMQLASMEKSGRYYSSSMADAAFRQVYLRTRAVDFSEAANFLKAKKLLPYMSGLIAAATILFALSGDLRAAAGRLYNFDSEFIPPARFVFHIVPGNSHITRGQDIYIKARISGPVPKEVFIATKSAEETDFQYRQLYADSTGLYTFEVTAVRISFDYFFRAEDVSSGGYRIEVVDRPVIKTLDLTITPPGYSGQTAVTQKDNGNVTALPGSRMSFSISSTKTLKNAYLEFNDSTTFRLNVDGSNAAGTYTVRKDIDYRIILTSTDGNKNESPITYSVKTLADASPSIEMILPARDITLSEDNRAAFLLKIGDDYGFSRLVLHYSVTNEGHSAASMQLDVPFAKNSKAEDVNYIWNLTNLNLSSKDVVSYYFEVLDNDNVNGPKSARTATYSIRIPSLDELLNSADKTQDNAEKKLSNLLKEAAQLKETLKDIRQDLKQDKKDISWQEKERMEKALDKFSQLENNIKEVRKEISDMQNDLRENNLLSKETLQKYMQLQELFREMTSEDMKKAIEKMEQALQQMNRDKVEQSLDEFKFNEEQFQSSIERTMKLLQRIQIEQKTDEVVRRAEMIEKAIEQQKQSLQKNELNNPRQRNEMSGKQQEITRQMNDLSESMKDLDQKMDQIKDMPNDQMNKMMQQFAEQKNQQLSQKAGEQIENGQKQQAENSENQMQQNMQQMQNSMSGMQKQMQQKNQRQAFNEMRRIMDNLLSLSKEQEELKNQSQELEQNSTAYSNNAKRQNGLMGNMDKMFGQLNQLSQKSFSVTPEMAKSLGDARNSMRNATSALQERNGGMARQSQTKAMSSLNEAAAMMKNSMESMMNGGGSGGMMSLMQQLGQLSQQQMNLNNMTQSMRQGQLTQQQMAQMQRLAQQQDLIRKSLEQLNRESQRSGNSKKLPANLDQIAKEMEEAVSEMRSEHFGDNLVQKQEKILSRMLDAQRSVNDRDFEQQRQSESGRTAARGTSPAELNLRSPKGRDQLKDELSRAVQEGFSRDYENLIRKYFESLMK